MAGFSTWRARALREAARSETLVRIAEAAPISYDPRASAGTLQTLVIAEGQGSCGWYLPEAIESIIPLIEGADSYYDHPSRSEEADIPERRVRNKCGWFSQPSLGTFSDPQSFRILAAAFAVFHPRDSDTTIAGLIETTYAKAARYPKSEPFAALSVNAIGVGATGPSPLDGTPTRIIAKFLQLDSIDVVTTAGRLGRFLVADDAKAPARRESAVRETRPKTRISYLSPL